jgi:hypothetical protein
MITLTLPNPHTAQRHVIDTARRFNVVCCGRRWGKTELGMDRLIQPALQGKPVAWFAPTYKLLAPVWREFQGRLYPVTQDSNQQERRLELKGGGSLEMWSLDSADSGRGRSYAEIVIDEAALVADLETAWQESIRPMLTDHQGGAWFLSTPKGIANYFHALYQRGQDPEQHDWASWQMPTGANPYIAAAEIESARADVTDLVFSQEYRAQFVSWAGSVFRRIQDAVAEPPADGRAVIIGCDWGRVNDYTVFVALTADGQVLAIDRFRGLEYSLQRGRLQAFWQRLGGHSWIVAEQNSIGGPVLEQLQRDGLPAVGFTTTNVSKAAAIESLALAFERGEIRIPNDANLIGELQAFAAKPLPSGMMRYCAPEGLHDDCVMALAIGWYALGVAAQQMQTLYLDPANGRLTDKLPGCVEISPY